MDDAQARVAAQYLELLKKMLTRYGFESEYRPVSLPSGILGGPAGAFVSRLLNMRGLKLCRQIPADLSARTDGRDHPNDAETMIGLKRLGNLQDCIENVLRDDVPGDLIETGVWRGGATIFMRGALVAYGDADRVVWVADSFRGLPKPNPTLYPVDEGDQHWTFSSLNVSRQAVEKNFERYGLLDERVRFLEGWFKDTLHSAPIERLAVMRLDGDMYESTMEALRALYPKLSPGGYVIVDDYGAVPGCRAATDDFRAEFRLVEEMIPIDWTGVFWRRLA